MARTARTIALLLLSAGAALVLGCSGATLLAYTGGGLPPGEPDLGGIVVAAVDAAAVTGSAEMSPQQATAPVEGAEVVLLRGRNEVGRATTGPEGYFRFEHPDTGSYELVVSPPASRPDLRDTRRAVSHVRNRRTFVTIELPRVSSARGAAAGPSQ